MADLVGYKPNIIASGGATTVPLTFVDQSDGTYAEKVVATLAAGTVEIGEVSIDQDTPGTTNAVSIAQIGANTVNAGVGAAGTGTIRVAVATDSGLVPVIGAAAGASIVASTAYEASRVLKASAGTLLSLVGYNSKASAQFIQIYNSATVPADTAVPIYTFTVPAASNFSVDVPVTGMPFTTGISVANSSTGPTKTIGSNDTWFTAVIK